VTKLHGIFYAMLSSAAFGFVSIFAKMANNNGMNSLTVLSLRFLLAFLILLIYFLIKKVDFKVNKKQLQILLLVGVLGYTATGMTMFFSYHYIPVGMATTLHFIYPAIVVVFNYLIYKEVLTKNKVIALLLSMVGVYILIGMKSTNINLFGAVLALASGFTYTGCVMGMNHPEVKKLDNTVQVFYFSLFAGITFLLFTILSGKLGIVINPYTVVSIIGISTISTIVSIVLFIKALKIIGPSSTSILGTFEPIVSIIMGIILFGEVLTPVMFAGTILILLSVVILAREKTGLENNESI